jgi:hypothetical protein
MFLPEVTNIRSRTILAAVVRPTSCLIDPEVLDVGGHHRVRPARSPPTRLRSPTSR